MKDLNKIFTALLCICLICVIAIAEILYCLHNTLLSPDHFARFLDNDKKLSQLTVLIYSSLAESAKSESKYAAISQYSANILNKSDQNWVKSQVYIGATGLQKYLASEATTLPTLDFVPLKEVIRDSLVSQAMKQPQAINTINKVKTVLSVLNNKYFSAIIKYGFNNQLVTMLLELAPIKSTGFDSQTLSEIIKVYLSLSDKSITLDQASYSIVEQMIANSFELDSFKDYFDIDLFLEKAFANDNPVAAFKTLINKLDTSVTFLTIFLFWCFVLLILINQSFFIVRFLKLMLYCIIFASVFNILLAALLINPISSQKLIILITYFQGNPNSFWIKLWVFLSRDYGMYLALQSVLLSIIAVIAYFIIRLIFNKSTKPKSLTRRFSTWRPIAAIIGLVLIFSWWNYYSIKIEIKNFQGNILKLSSTDINQSVINGFIEAGGMNFLKYIQKK